MTTTTVPAMTALYPFPDVSTPQQQALLRSAQFLNHMRIAGRGVSLNAAEAMLLIAAGVDNARDLARYMSDRGVPLDEASVRRLVGLLRGRARRAGDRWVEAPYSLVSARPHPHRPGLQLRLTEEGRRLVDLFFPQDGATGSTVPPVQVTD